MGKLESLVVDLQLETAQLRRGLDSANKKLDHFAKEASKIGDFFKNTFGAILTFEAVQALAQFVNSGVEAVDAMGKMAQSAGATVAEFSKIAYAARAAGVENEELGSAFEKLAKKMNEAALGGTEQAALFNALGVEVKDASGTMRTSSDVFEDLVDVFSRMEDGVAKTALAQEVFGKSGADLIPVLNAGKQGLADMADEAERFGLVVTDESAAAADAFGDAIGRVGERVNGLAQKVAVDLAPIMTELLDSFTKGESAAAAFDVVAKSLVDTIKFLASGAAVAWGALKGLGVAIAGVIEATQNAIKNPLGTPDSTLHDTADVLKETAKDVQDRLNTIWGGGKKGAGEEAQKEADKVVGAAERVHKKIKETASASKDAEKAAKEAARAEKEAMDDAAAAWQRLQEKRLALSTASREVDATIEGRRNAPSFGVPVQSFSKFHQMLDEAGEALKHEAELRIEADALRAEMDYEAADAALAAADAQGKLADTFMEGVDLFQLAWEGMQAKVIGRSGRIAGLVESAQMGAQMAGPWGAVAAVGVDLLSQSTQFQSIVDELDGFIQVIADTLGTVLGPTLEALGPVLGWVAGLFKSLEPILGFVGEVIGAFVSIVDVIFQGVAGVWNFILDTLQSLLGWLGVDFKKHKLKMVDMTKETERNTDATRRSTDEKERESMMDHNLPAGYKVALALFNAMDPMAAPAGQPPSSTPERQEIDVKISLDTDMLLAEIQRENRTQRTRTRGTPVGYEPWGGG